VIITAAKTKSLKMSTDIHWNPSQRCGLCHMDYGITWVRCYLRPNTSHLKPIWINKYSFYLPPKNGKLSWPWCTVIYRKKF